MKKVILILTVAAFFVACNDSASKTDVVTDSTVVTGTVVDTNMVTPAPATMDTLNKMSADSTIR